MRDVQEQMAVAMVAGVAPGSAESHRLVRRHRDAFSAFFPITVAKHVCLGRTYEADPSFRAYHDAIRPGLAAWLRAAIDAEAREHGVDPETATWD